MPSSYEIRYAQSAAKDRKALIRHGRSTFERKLQETLDALKVNPYNPPGGFNRFHVEKLPDDSWKAWIDYRHRVRYLVEQDTVIILWLGTRESAYKDL